MRMGDSFRYELDKAGLSQGPSMDVAPCRFHRELAALYF
jgi:hypothetical protein